MKENNGVFRKRRGFSIIPNNVARNKNLSQKAKGLYVHIMSYITIESKDFTLTKAFLLSDSQEGEKAFEKSWNELKNAGFLKVYFTRGERGRWITEYDLLEVATDPEVHTFYCDQHGQITSTNIDRAKKKEEAGNCSDEEIQQDPTVTPKMGVTVKDDANRIPQNGRYRDGRCGKGDNNNNTLNNTLNNTDLHQFNSFQEQHKLLSGMDEVKRRKYLTEKVQEECIDNMEIPYWYNQDRDRTEIAIHILSDWDVYLQNNKDSPKKAIFIAFNEALIDMCTSEFISFKNSTFNYAKVIDKINLMLEPGKANRASGLIVFNCFCDFVMEKFTDALKLRSINNYQRYMQSVIWESLQKYDLKFYEELLKEGFYYDSNNGTL